MGTLPHHFPQGDETAALEPTNLRPRRNETGHLEGFPILQHPCEPFCGHGPERMPDKV